MESSLCSSSRCFCSSSASSSSSSSSGTCGSNREVEGAWLSKRDAEEKAEGGARGTVGFLLHSLEP